MTQRNHTMLVDRSNGCIVAFMVGNSSHLMALNVDGEYRSRALVVCNEIDAFSVGIPRYVVYSIVPIGSQVGFLTRLHIHHKNSVFVRFVPVVFHRKPSNFVTLRREYRVGVVAEHTIGEICCLASSQVVKIEVGICRFGVFATFKFARHVDNRFRIGRPYERLNTAKRLHRGFERLAFYHVDDVRQAIAIEVGYKRMRNF